MSLVAIFINQFDQAKVSTQVEKLDQTLCTPKVEWKLFPYANKDPINDVITKMEYWILTESFHFQGDTYGLYRLENTEES